MSNQNFFSDFDFYQCALSKNVFAVSVPCKIEFLLLGVNTRGRAFQRVWYNKKDWLCGSSVLEKLLCWPCLLFYPATSLRRTKNGFHGFLLNCKKHEKAKSHISAYKTWRTCRVSVRVDSLLSQARWDEIQRHNEEVRQNRKILRTMTV